MTHSNLVFKETDEEIRLVGVRAACDYLKISEYTPNGKKKFNNFFIVLFQIIRKVLMK